MGSSFDSSVINKYRYYITADPHHRYRSWDHCFQVFSAKGMAAETLALHLGFYLASWGMYRGSSGLLQKNHLIHEGAVKIICSDEFNALKCNDNKEVTRESIQLILELKKALSDYYSQVSFVRGGKEKKISDTDTLLSKILLGTMACVPAYDQYFVNGLKKAGFNYCTFDSTSLNELFDFIEINKKPILKAQESIKEKTGYHYPLMKIMDMYFWQIGFDTDSQKGNKAVL